MENNNTSKSELEGYVLKKDNLNTKLDLDLNQSVKDQVTIHAPLPPHTSIGTIEASSNYVKQKEEIDNLDFYSNIAFIVLFFYMLVHYGKTLERERDLIKENIILKEEIEQLKLKE
jgi:hypothetical protein